MPSGQDESDPMDTETKPIHFQPMSEPAVSSVEDLLSIAVGLGSREVIGWTSIEEALVKDLPRPSDTLIDDIRARIIKGEDPLGSFYCMLTSPANRRGRGATYTPAPIVKAMLDWASSSTTPERVVDPGTGSGRFIVEAGRRFKRADLVGIELDPIAAVLARGHLSAAGLVGRSRILLGDYRSVTLPKIRGRTLYIGNPPYLRHHEIEPEWKQWLTREAKLNGLPVSQLAGLHAHFLLATALAASPGDYGAFIMASEWLDVNYGKLMRALFLRQLGGNRIVVIDPKAMPFQDAATTGSITCFEIGDRPDNVYFKWIEKLDELSTLSGGKPVRRDWLVTESRWSHATQEPRTFPEGYVQLGSFCRVHRGQVTGANEIWIEGKLSKGLPDSVMFPAITRASELYKAGEELIDASHLRRVIDIPPDLAMLGPDDRSSVEAFLDRARVLGADRGYIARTRRAWWSVGLRQQAPILATYMARRPPTFVLNSAGVRNINIAHGLYPICELNLKALKNLAKYLSTTTRLTDGRTYAGGLTKFEPKEMERLMVPGPRLLMEELDWQSPRPNGTGKS
jgi:methylase of polypeptide subunit release factors